jgi:hypothetical protein
MAIVRGMTVDQAWGGIGAQQMLGVKPADFGSGPKASMGGMTPATRPVADANGEKPWHPDNPLFWFGILLATTFGLIGAATSVRVGPFRASVGAGQT